MATVHVFIVTILSAFLLGCTNAIRDQLPLDHPLSLELQVQQIEVDEASGIVIVRTICILENRSDRTVKIDGRGVPRYRFLRSDHSVIPSVPESLPYPFNLDNDLVTIAPGDTLVLSSSVTTNILAPWLRSEAEMVQAFYQPFDIPEDRKIEHGPIYSEAVSING